MRNGGREQLSGAAGGARSPTSSRARQLLHLVWLRGPRRTAGALVQGYLFAFRRWYIFYRSIPSGPPPPPSSEFECRLATAADVESFAVFEPNRQRREVRAWLEGGALLRGRPARGVPMLRSLRAESGQIMVSNRARHSLSDRSRRELEQAERVQAKNVGLIRAWTFDPGRTASSDRA